MKKFNSKQVLIDRGHMFEKHFGKADKYNNGKIKFPKYKEPCTLSYVSKNNLMSRNYYLSLQTEVIKATTVNNKKSYCYLNRLGSWKFKGDDKDLKKLSVILKDHKKIKSLLQQTDLESITISSIEGRIKLHVNLYGGGFSAIMLPPIKLDIGIPAEQILPSAELFKNITTEIKKVA